jgi:hypothetical protein
MEGGLVVRSDGNNFIAEMAAASIVLKACPNHLNLETIGALSKGVVSERKRLRAAGRAWLNLCRLVYVEMGKRIKMEHVSSHKGTQTPEQQGNDTADRLANEFRLLGEASQPAPYLLETEESLLFKHNENIVQGDPRDYLKRLEKEHMIKKWKTTVKQSEWFVKHPTQVLKQAKQVWRWSVECGQGKAWLYFIFAVCQWLPTNYRMNYLKDDLSKNCNLCLCNAPDNSEHLLRCPALIEQHLCLKEEVKNKFYQWSIPFSSISLPLPEMEFHTLWSRAAREKLRLSISEYRLRLLTKGYWKTNRQKQFISTKSF